MIHNHTWLRPNATRKRALYSLRFINHIVLVLRVFRQSKDKIMPSSKYYESHLLQQNLQTRCKFSSAQSPHLKPTPKICAASHKANHMCWPGHIQYSSQSRGVSSSPAWSPPCFVLCSPSTELLTKPGKWNAECPLDNTVGIMLEILMQFSERWCCHFIMCLVKTKAFSTINPSKKKIEEKLKAF